MTRSDIDEVVLKRLNPGAAGPILVADFQALSLAPRISEMLGQSFPDRPVFQIDPVGALTGEDSYIPLPDLARACADEFHAAGADSGPVFVVGHCSAAALTLRVADLLAPSRTVTAVLVQPAWPDDELVAGKFAEYLGKFGPATRTCPRLDADPSEVVTAMERIFREEIDALTARQNLVGASGAFTDLLVWYRGWLAFLLACRNDKPTARAVARAAVTVLSDSPSTVSVPGRTRDEYELQALATPQPAGLVTRELADLVAAYIASGRA